MESAKFYDDMADLEWESDFTHETYRDRMDVFEERLFGSKKKHARIPNVFDKEDYMAFIRTELYENINSEIIALRDKRRELQSKLYQALPTGEKHEWFETEGGMVVRIRPEYLNS